MKGADAIVNGTIAAVDPIEVPATSRVNGMMATTRMMKGVDRVALTMMPSTRLTTGAANSSPFRLVARKTPSGRPKAVPISAASPTMYRLSPVAWTIRLMSSGDIAETLRGELILREPGQRARRRALAAGRAERDTKRQRAYVLAADLVDAGRQQRHVEAEFAREPRHQ